MVHAFLLPANEFCEGYVFTGVCLSTEGVCMCGGGVHGGWGVCMAGGGGMRGGGGHAWQGGHACHTHTPADIAGYSQ